MINREDMMELTRRMTPARTSMTRIAGCYIDCGGEIDGTFNTSFLKLSPSEKGKKLAAAKTIPFSGTNEKLRRYSFPDTSMKPGSLWQLLMGLRSCGLKNDALMDTFYDLVLDAWRPDHACAILMFHDRYDIPAKAADHERLWESEEVFEYMICAVCPLLDDYELGKPEFGFLFPAFSERSAAHNQIDVFEANPGKPHSELLQILEVSF